MIKDEWLKINLDLPKKVLVTIRVDPDVAKFLRDQGAGWTSKTNKILRAYMEANR